jgi:hypothetical protein
VSYIDAGDDGAQPFDSNRRKRMAKELDAVDREIVGLVTAQGRISHEEVARRVHERVKRLERDGVIRGYRAVVDWSAVDLGLCVFVSVQADHDRLAKVIDRLLVPSETTMVGLLTHLVTLEQHWFGIVLGGQEHSMPFGVDDPDGDVRAPLEWSESLGQVHGEGPPIPHAKVLNDTQHARPGRTFPPRTPGRGRPTPVSGHLAGNRRRRASRSPHCRPPGRPVRSQ